MKVHSCNFKGQSKSLVVIYDKNSDEIDGNVKRSAKNAVNLGNFEYRLLHKWSQTQQRCIYALVYKKTEAASKANVDAFKNWEGENAWELVPSYSFIPQFREVPASYLRIAKKFEEALSLYATVVPSKLLTNVVQDLCLQRQKLQENRPENRETVDKGILSVINKLLEIENSYKKEVKQEVQRNDFSYTHLKEPLKELGFIAKDTIEHCSICQYGKSFLDMYFYKDGGGLVSCGMIQSQEQQIVSGVTEFKVDQNLKICFGQMFADMVKVGATLSYEALTRGVVIDKVVVYGLLTNYSTEQAYPMRYTIDFNKEASNIVVGNEINAVKAFVGVLQLLQQLTN